MLELSETHPLLFKLLKMNNPTNFQILNQVISSTYVSRTEIPYMWLVFSIGRSLYQKKSRGDQDFFHFF
jgi:hypothetical protein